MMHIEATVNWPDGSTLRATMDTPSPDLTADVALGGSPERVAALPPRLRNSGRHFHGTLIAQLTAHARLTAGKLTQRASGTVETWTR